MVSTFISEEGPRRRVDFQGTERWAVAGCLASISLFVMEIVWYT